MTLVTRCPACETTFKVVPDQLRISEGWVRCGRCSQVFDASIELRETHDIEPVAAPQQPQSQLQPHLQPAPESEPEPEPEPYVAGEPVLDAAALVAHAVSAPPSLAGDADPVARDRAATRASRGVLTIGRAAPSSLEKAVRRARARRATIEQARDKAAGRRAALLFAAEGAPGAVAARGDMSLEPAMMPPTPSFAREARPFPGRSGWTGGRKALLAIVGLAVFLLGFQVLQHERNAIVARQPALRPVFVAWCALVGCEVSALRQISAITIDGASFSREAGGGYRLDFTLRNAAATPLAMPAVELSLLDTQEKPVVRRVLLPEQFGAPAVLPAGADRAVTLPLVLSVPESAALAPVAGYRVVAFYP